MSNSVLSSLRQAEEWQKSLQSLEERQEADAPRFISPWPCRQGDLLLCGHRCLRLAHGLALAGGLQAS